MWIIISFIFLLGAIITKDINYWFLWSLMIIAHNIEYLAIQVKHLVEQKKK